MKELNLQKALERQKVQAEREQEEIQVQEIQLRQKRGDLLVRQRELEAHELELQEKGVLLDIAIRVTEISLK